VKSVCRTQTGSVLNHKTAPFLFNHGEIFIQRIYIPVSGQFLQFLLSQVVQSHLLLEVHAILMHMHIELLLFISETLLFCQLACHATNVVDNLGQSSLLVILNSNHREHFRRVRLSDAPRRRIIVSVILFNHFLLLKKLLLFSWDLSACDFIYSIVKLVIIFSMLFILVRNVLCRRYVGCRMFL
jgi:hypothetical protein